MVIIHETCDKHKLYFKLKPMNAIQTWNESESKKERMTKTN